MEVDDNEARYSAAIDSAVRQLFSLPAVATAELTFGARVDVQLPAVSTGAPTAPPDMKVAPSSSTELGTIDVKVERLYEKAMDAQESKAATSQTKADAWCALSTAGASAYSAKAKVACREWRMFAAEEPFLADARRLETAPNQNPMKLAYEDVDLAWRLRNKGYRHLYEPRALALHERRGANKKPRDIAERAFVNRYATWLKNESFLRFLVYGLLALGWEAVRLVRRYSNGGQLDWCEIRRRLALAWHAR